MSNRDSFWGAKPNQGETTLIGINILGQLLTSLRDELRRQKGYTGETVTRYLTGVKTNTLVINGKTVIGKDSEWPVNFLMVAHGWAYHYKEPSAMRNHCLLEAERIAKDSRKGVWQDGTNGASAPGNTGGTGVKAPRTYRGNEKTPAAMRGFFFGMLFSWFLAVQNFEVKE